MRSPLFSNTFSIDALSGRTSAIGWPYCARKYSISTCVSFTPAFGSAVVNVRAIPWIPTSLPVPPMMGPTVVAVRLLSPGPCTATTDPRVKNLSPFSSRYTQ